MSNNLGELPAAEPGYASKPLSPQPRLEIRQHQIYDKQLLTRAKELIGDDFLAVDLGCGIGEVGVDRFASVGVDQILGLDVNPSYIKRARERFPEQKFETINAEEKEFRQFLVKQDKPLLIFSAMTFHHFHDPVRVMRTILEHAPLGSVLVIRTLDDGSKVDFQAGKRSHLEEILVLSDNAPTQADRRHGRKLRQQLFRSGFRDIETSVFTVNTADMDRNQRKALYRACFSHRADSWKNQEKLDEQGKENLSRMLDALNEYELDIEQPGYFMIDVLFGAVAQVKER